MHAKTQHQEVQERTHQHREQGHLVQRQVALGLGNAAQQEQKEEREHPEEDQRHQLHHAHKNQNGIGALAGQTGKEVVVLPRTEGISSTMIKEYKKH